jgi:hypothetical protein
LIQVVKGTVIASADRFPRITLNSALGRIEGLRAEKGGHSTRTITLTIRFWVEGSNRDAVTEVMEVLRKAFPHADFRVLEFAGNICVVAAREHRTLQTLWALKVQHDGSTDLERPEDEHYSQAAVIRRY